MKYRKLGKTGLKVSVIGVGTWQFGGEWGKRFAQSEVDQILGRAKTLGTNLIDTAECYGDHLAESLVGKAIERDRHNWVVSTKFGHKFHENFKRTDEWSPEAVRQQLEDSLRALRTDYIDIYHFHSGSNEAFDRTDLWDMLARQVKAGKIRHLALSIGSNLDGYQTARASDVGASVIQCVYNRLDRAPEQAVFPHCQAQGLGVLAREPLANGLLSGKYAAQTVFRDQNDWRAHWWEPSMVRHKLEQVEGIKQSEVPSELDMATWALAWCLQHPAVASVIPGCKSVEQFEANARAVDLDLMHEDHPLAWS
jgi:aryl-alcohol dehydrogenase-like predicted oxidoreductase